MSADRGTNENRRKPDSRASGVVTRDQPGLVRREVRLASHPPDYTDTTVTVHVSGDHARIAFDGYWHGAQIALEHAELALVRDAIDQALAAEIPPEENT